MLYYLKTFNGKRGDIIYKVNEPAKFLYFIKFGEIKVCYNSYTKIIQQVDVINPRELLSEVE